VLQYDTNVSEVYAASVFRVQGPLKRWYHITTLYVFTTHQTWTWIFTTVKTSNHYNLKM